ncbi:hypothetical protein WICPIJ_005836 [Wickerhamomyces pijperi]|uniref:Glutaredoxin domain-containing protein n=1 Tax=Wickerhamomyces pijperi TaxID=599730 RepID=A0A9P8TLF9_WICPI|nr:hypothetical protein WICPIJ_005836 [Wickerhamomyces pijperi]
MVSQSKKAQTYLTTHPYLIVSKSWCPGCKYTKKTLQTHKVLDKFHIIELDKMKDQKEADDLQKAFTAVSGRRSVPSIFIKGKLWGGDDQLKELESLERVESWLRGNGINLEQFNHMPNNLLHIFQVINQDKALDSQSFSDDSHGIIGEIRANATVITRDSTHLDNLPKCLHVQRGLV